MSLTDWLDLMLDEIARRKAEEAEARAEVARRRAERDGGERLTPSGDTPQDK